MAHYDWDCETCDFSGGIYDDQHKYVLKKNLSLSNGKTTTNYIYLCNTCNKQLRYGKILFYEGTDQTISIEDVVR